MAAEGQKRKPPMRYPPELKPYFAKQRIPSGSLGRVRRAIEADPTLPDTDRGGALPELVDESGGCGSSVPTGWEAAEDLASSAAPPSPTRSAASRRRTPRSGATPQSRRRTRPGRAGAAPRRIAAQRARDRRAARRRGQGGGVAGRAAGRADRRPQRDPPRPRPRGRGDQQAAERREPRRRARQLDRRQRSRRRLAAAPSTPAAAELVAARRGRAALADQLDDLLPRSRASRPRRPAPRTQPLRCPGRDLHVGRAAEFSCGPTRSCSIDGYNVAKLGGRRSTSRASARRCSTRREPRRRFGTDITVVFDGASSSAPTPIGADDAGVYSPAGVIADDVIRDEVRRLPRPGRSSWSPTTPRSSATCAPTAPTRCRATRCSPCSDRQPGYGCQLPFSKS